MLAVALAAIDLGVTHAIDCRAISLTDEATSHPSESREEVLGESDYGFDGDAFLFVKGPFAGLDEIANEVLGRSEIEWE